MLKEGTLVKVDQTLIRAVKYALDQMGISADTLIAGRRRRSTLNDALPADYGEAAGGDAYNGYFKVSAAASDEQQRITKLLVSEGVTDLPGNRTVAPVSFDIDPGKNFEVILVLERSEEGPRSRLKNTVILAPGETVTSAAFEREYQSRFVLLASVVNTGENPGIIQRWTDNVVYWGSRFFI